MSRLLVRAEFILSAIVCSRGIKIELLIDILN